MDLEIACLSIMMSVLPTLDMIKQQLFFPLGLEKFHSQLDFGTSGH